MEKNKIKKILVAGLSLLVMVVLGYNYFASSYESTENAYLKSDIIILRPKVSGYISKILVEENQQVKKGDILALIDDKDYKIRVAQAEALHEYALARVVTLEEQLKIYESNIKEVEAKNQATTASFSRAKRDLERAQELIKEQAISKQSFDKAIEVEKSAQAAQLGVEANISAVKQQLNVVKSQIKEAQAQVKSSSTALDLAKIDLENTVIKAPMDAIVSKRALQVGQLAQPALALAYLIYNNKIWIVANFKEVEITDMRPGQSSIIKIDSFPNKKFSGKVISIYPATGAEFSILPSENATGNFTKIVQRIPVRIEFDSGQDLSLLKPGMSCLVKVILDK